MIEDTLKALGLKEKEIKVYLALMTSGRATPSTLAEKTSLNRATVYSVLEILLKKGLVTEDVGGTLRTFLAEKPKDLNILIEKEKQALNRKVELVEQAIQELSDLPLNTEYAVPHVRLLTEEQLDLAQKEDVAKWEESMRKTDPTFTWWGFQDDTYAKHYESWINWYWKRAPKDIQLKLLSNHSPIEEEFKEKQLTNRQIKYLSDKTKFTATTWVLGEYLIMVYTNSKPFYAIEIFNPILAHNYRELFKEIWERI